MMVAIVRFILLTVISSAMFWSSSATADTQACTRRQAIAAEEESSTLRSWGALYQSYRRYSHCDDGAISEGYSYSVAWLLAERWDGFGELLDLTKQSRDFEDFVVSHVNETMSQSQADQLMRNLSSQCPTSGAKLCSRLKKAVQASS